MEKPLILVTNDDGINAPGIRCLIDVMSEIGEVIVVAQDSPQSCMGHAITINSTLHCSKISPKSSKRLEYSCSGTPADCVKLAVNELMPRKPDLCVSGINHGANSSINVIYSGTMSAAVEAGIEGIKSIGFSLLDYSWNADFKPCKSIIEKICLSVLNQSRENLILNVNFPSKIKKFKGIKVCRQAKGYWEDTYDKRISPLAKENYSLTRSILNQDNEKETSNSVYLSPGASLVIRDYDLDSDTLNDQSKLRSDVTGKGNYTEKINYTVNVLSLIHISEPTRLLSI